jgi:hypothetical protein
MCISLLNLLFTSIDVEVIAAWLEEDRIKRSTRHANIQLLII